MEDASKINVREFHYSVRTNDELNHVKEIVNFMFQYFIEHIKEARENSNFFSTITPAILSYQLSNHLNKNIPEQDTKSSKMKI